MDMDVSVIIPVHYGGDFLRRCLQSVEAAQPSAKEIIVVADGDTDGAWKVAEEAGHRVLRMATPGGPARARNQGGREATGGILFFVDADVTIPKDMIGRVRSAFHEDPDLAALFGSYDDDPHERNFLSQYKNLFHHYVHQHAREDAFTFWSACGAIRRDVFKKIGGFDERYRRASVEDIEMGHRLKKAGYKINLVKELQIKHLKRWGVLSLLRADIFYRAIPWTEIILRAGKMPADLNLGIYSRICVILACSLLLTLMAAFFRPWLLLPAVFMTAALLAINWRMYKFFYEKRGWVFAVKVIPWHWLYFLYSGFAFLVGFAKFQAKRGLSALKRPTEKEKQRTGL